MPVLSRVEAISVGSVWGEKFHTTREHELIHVVHGNAKIHILDRVFPVGPGDTFVIPKGTSHKDVSEEAEADAYRVIMVWFEWPGCDTLIGSVDPGMLLAAPAAAKTHLGMMARELESEFASEAGDAGSMQSILFEILLALLRYSRPAEAPAEDAKRLVAHERRRKLAADVREHLLAHCADTISLEALAEAHGVSPFHLSRCFSQEFGVSMTDMIAMIRIDRAKELLKDNSSSVKEVAAKVGYSDANYFAKVFRRTSGQSPTEYQASLQRART